MPMTNDEFRSKLNLLGLDTDKTPASQEDVSSMADPEQSDAPESVHNPGVGFQGNPGQEKSPLTAASPEDQQDAQDSMMPQSQTTGSNMSVQPSAQVASSDAGDMGGDAGAVTPETKALMPVPGKKQTPEEQTEAQKTISSVIQNPVVSQYIQNKYGQNVDLNDVALKEAQDIASNRKLAAGFGAGFETIARAPSNIKPDTQFYEDMSKNADSGVKDLQVRQKARTDQMANDLSKQKLQQEMEDNDPNSPQANELRKAYARTFKALGVDEGMLASASPRIMKDYYSKILESANTAEMRKQAAEFNRQMRQDKIDQDNSYKNASMQDKISKEINTLSQSSRNALGQSGRVMVSADRALKILDQKVVTPEDLNSVSSDISNLVSGQSTVAGAKDQQYKTLQTKLAAATQALGSNPQDVNSPQLRAHLRDVISGMREISVGTAHKNAHFIEVSHPEFAAKNPHYFEDIAKALAEQDQPGSLDANTPQGSAGAGKGTATPVNGTPKTPNAMSSSGFPKQVRNSSTGKVATVNNAQEAAEAKHEGFN